MRERKKWPSWLMRAACGVAWRAVIRIVIRLIHSGREVGKSAAAAAAASVVVVVVVVVASRGGRYAGRSVHSRHVLYSPRCVARRNYLLTQSRMHQNSASRRPILRANL